MAILTEGERQLLLAAIEQRTGIRHRPDQLESAGELIAKVMSDAGIERTDDFLTALDRDGSVFEQLVDAITIGETYFFREPLHFEFIRDHVIPEFRIQYGEQTRFRAWSAACSSGEEPYSLAILCEELGIRYDILGTDIAAAAIGNAKRGRYRDWSFRGDMLKRIAPYLRPEMVDRQRVLNAQIRRAVRFRILNLVAGVYPETKLGTAFRNLILCRNVLIYFDQATARHIAGRLVECLAPGGWLITASADLPLGNLPGLTAVTNQWGTFYRRDEAVKAIGFGSPGRDQQRWQSPVPESPSIQRAGKDHEFNASNHPGKRLAQRGTGPLADKSHVGETAAPRPSPLATSTVAESMGPPGSLAPRTAGICPGEPTAAFGPDWLRGQLEMLDQIDPEVALAKIADLAAAYPLETQLHYHHGRRLMEAGEAAAAAKAIQKALFLEQSAIMPHFLFGTIQISRGQWESARRHLGTARRLCLELQSESRVPMSGNMIAANLLAALDSQLARLPKPPDG